MCLGWDSGASGRVSPHHHHAARSCSRELESRGHAMPTMPLLLFRPSADSPPCTNPTQARGKAKDPLTVTYVRAMPPPHRVLALARHLHLQGLGGGKGESGSSTAAPRLEASPTSAAGTAVTVVTTRVEDGVGVVTLNRPDRGNAFTMEMQERYFDALERMDKDESVVAVVVTGAGRQFCVGADKDLLTTGTASASSTASGGESLGSAPARDVSQLLATKMSKPLVVAINGAVAGLGLVAALMGDVRFATRGVKFTTAFAKRGLIAEHGIAWVLPRVVGHARALDLLMSSRVVSTDEALQMGLVNFVSPDPDACVRDAIKYARECGRLCSPAALAEIKRQMWDPSLTLRDDAERAQDLMRRSFVHPDFTEGVNSLVEKRDPTFVGLKAGFVRDLGVLPKRS